MTDADSRLLDAVREIMQHQFTHTRPAMHALTELVDAAEHGAHEIDRLRRDLADITIERDILRRDNANMRASVHTCGPTCSMAGCVNARLQEQLDECGVEAVRLLGLADDGARYREALAELVRIYVKEGAATTPAVEIGAAWDQARTELGEA